MDDKNDCDEELDEEEIDSVDNDTDLTDEEEEMARKEFVTRATNEVKFTGDEAEFSQDALDFRVLISINPVPFVAERSIRLLLARKIRDSYSSVKGRKRCCCRCLACCWYILVTALRLSLCHGILDGG